MAMTSPITWMQHLRNSVAIEKSSDTCHNLWKKIHSNNNNNTDNIDNNKSKTNYNNNDPNKLFAYLRKFLNTDLPS